MLYGQRLNRASLEGTKDTIHNTGPEKQFWGVRRLLLPNLTLGGIPAGIFGGLDSSCDH